jgi:hypothetical protein
MEIKINTSYCAKIPHATYAKALAHLRQLRRARRRPGRRPLKPIEQGLQVSLKALQIYRCERCNALHVGHDQAFNVARNNVAKKRA